jgi:aminoglycoside phosphotransferase (APT) family kinase protein
MDTLRATVERALGGQYEVLHLIGRGGMGAVYLARERFLERLVAVKVLPHETAGQSTGRQRFLREAQTAARLSHPSIVPLHTFVEAEGTLLYVMGYVEGESLESLLVREGRMTPHRAARILSEIADALHYAHSLGVVHRDVKPDNILIDRASGRAFLTDFGIARQGTGQGITKTGMVVGTPHYMSPEQASADRDLDGRSDLYSLGVVGYRMLSGRLPFDAPSFQELLVQQVTRDPAPIASETHSHVSDAVMKALQKDPVARWPSGAAFVAALRDPDSLEETVPDDVANYVSIVPTLAMVYGAGLQIAIMLAIYTRTWKPLLTAPLALAAITATTLGSALLRSFIRKEWKPREAKRVAMWPPKFWPGWWPKRFRRPGDVWNRLPLEVQKVRGTMSASMFALVTIVAPLVIVALILSSQGRMDGARVVSNIALGLSVAAMGATLTAGFRTRHWAKRFGVKDVVASRLALESSWSMFWRRPEIVALLEKSAAESDYVAAQTPAEMLRAIAAAVTAMPEPLRPAGEEAESAARRVFALIESIDREVAQLARDADPAERARLEEKLASLETQSGLDAAAPNRMHELLREQVTLYESLDRRRAQLLTDRDRSVNLLRNLHLQLARSRARFAEDALSGATLSAEIAALCSDLSNQNDAATEVDALLRQPATSKA